MERESVSVRNSSLVLGSSRKAPSMELVTVLLDGLETPLIVIHMCLGKEKKFRETEWRAHAKQRYK